MYQSFVPLTYNKIKKYRFERWVWGRLARICRPVCWEGREGGGVTSGRCVVMPFWGRGKRVITIQRQLCLGYEEFQVKENILKAIWHPEESVPEQACQRLEAPHPVSEAIAVDEVTGRSWGTPSRVRRKRRKDKARKASSPEGTALLSMVPVRWLHCGLFGSRCFPSFCQHDYKLSFRVTSLDSG